MLLKIELPEVGKFLVGLKSRKSCRVFNNSAGLLKPVEKIAFNRFLRPFQQLKLKLREAES